MVYKNKQYTYNNYSIQNTIIAYNQESIIEKSSSMYYSPHKLLQ